MNDDFNEDEHPSEFNKEELPDRPIECTECKRAIAFHYTEILGDSFTETCMCNKCPVLQRRLGQVVQKGAIPTRNEEMAHLCCGNCGTSLQAIQMGSLLGCSQCYHVFEDLLVNELTNSKKVSRRLPTKGIKTLATHIGRAPGEIAKLNPSMRLIALHEALDETLSREDYEQAAWLRDQIKELTEHPDDDSKK